MDSRKAWTALGTSLPGLLWFFVPSLLGDPAVSAWEPIILIVLGLAAWAIYWVFVEPRLHPTADELQNALDKMINYRYLSDGAELQPRRANGLSDEQVMLEHAPEDFRETWYGKLGLGKPKPSRDRYR